MALAIRSRSRFLAFLPLALTWGGSGFSKNLGFRFKAVEPAIDIRMHRNFSPTESGAVQIILDKKCIESLMFFVGMLSAPTTYEQDTKEIDYDHF